MIKLFLIALATALATTETLNIIPPSHAFEITYDCANMIPSQCIEAKFINLTIGIYCESWEQKSLEN